jgi:CarD family transcriptional regulator
VKKNGKAKTTSVSDAKKKGKVGTEKPAPKASKTAVKAPSKKPVPKPAPSKSDTSAKKAEPVKKTKSAPEAKKAPPAPTSKASLKGGIPLPPRSAKALGVAARPAPAARPMAPAAAPSTRRVAPPKAAPKPSNTLSAAAPAPPPPPPKPATIIPQPPRPPGPPLLRQMQHLDTQTPDKLTLAIADKAVHPRHGVGEVIAIETREIGGTKGEFYVLRILDDLTKKVMVPTNATGNAGLRPIMSDSQADSVLDTMRAKEVAVNEHPWSRRFRAYTEMINSGSPYEVAKVMRDMYRLKFDKDLSFGERRLLDQARSLLMKELALAKNMKEEDLQADVAKMFEA